MKIKNTLFSKIKEKIFLKEKLYKIIKHYVFDEDFYLKENIDVRQSKISPLEHFIKYGFDEGRRPSERKKIDNSNRLSGRKKVFCIGLNKTGTTSLELVLKESGYVVGNQREAVLTYCSYTDDWKENIYQQCDYSQFFQDVPFSLGNFYRDLDKQFPNSKFILTIRDSAEQWYNSLVNFHSKLFDPLNIPPSPDALCNNFHLEHVDLLSFICNTFGTYKDEPYNKEIMIKYYEDRNDEIRNYFRGRESDYLEINVAQEESYYNLCKFLNIEGSRNGFPHENRTSTKTEDFTNDFSTEIVIPISITRGFINQIKLFFYSLKSLGFLENGYRLNVIYHGFIRNDLFNESYSSQMEFDKNENILKDFILWSKINHVRLFCVSEEFINLQYPDKFSHCNYRYFIPISNSCESIILCDADTVFLKFFNAQSLLSAHSENCCYIAGHMVHYPSPYFDNDGNINHFNEYDWHRLFDILGLSKSRIDNICSIDNRGAGYQPPNYNFGFIVINPKMHNTLALHFNSFYSRIRQEYNTPMASQIALSAVGLNFKSKFKNLDASFNAANDDLHWKLNDLQSSDIKVLHYLREDEISREDFLLKENLESFLCGAYKSKGTSLLQKKVSEIINEFGRDIFI